MQQGKKLLFGMIGVFTLWQVAFAAEDCSYQVIKVKENDNLLIRFGPHIKYKKVGTIPHNATEIEVTGPEITVGKSRWVPIDYKGTAGWVNRGYLEADCPTVSTAADSASDSSSSPDYHTVAEGETLFSLSQQYGYDVEEIAQWNELPEPYNLSPGQSLRVSPANCSYRVVKVKANDMLWVRSDPSVKSERMGGIPHDGTGIEVTGPEQTIDKSRWIPIRYKGIAGWVNYGYLKKECD